VITIQIYVVLQLSKSCIVVTCIVGSKPPHLEIVSSCTWHEYNTHLFTNPVPLQYTSKDQSNVCSSVVALKQSKGELGFLEHPLLWPVLGAVDIMCGDQQVIVGTTLSSPCVECEGDFSLNTLIT
jgi:hypothetical protein